MFKLSLKPISVFISCLVTVIPLLGLSQHFGVHEVKFYKLSGQALVGNLTATRRVKDYFDCTFFCLELGPFACLSFNFGNTSDNGYYTCELNNSERYLEPHRIQDRQNFDYYGTTTEVSEKWSVSPSISLLGYRLLFVTFKDGCRKCFHSIICFSFVSFFFFFVQTFKLKTTIRSNLKQYNSSFTFKICHIQV